MAVTDTTPIFLFLSRVERKPTVPRSSQDTPFLALWDTEKDGEACVATPDGTFVFDSTTPGRLDGTGSRHPVWETVGVASLQDILFGHTLDDVAATFFETAKEVLCAMVDDEDIQESIAAYEMSTHEVFDDAGIARTRDALFWTYGSAGGLDPTIDTAVYIDELVGTSMDAGLRAAIDAGLAVAGLGWPQGVSLEDALATFYVGCVVDTGGSAHAEIALRARLAEDARLFAAAMEHLGHDTRPLVPVLI